MARIDGLKNSWGRFMHNHELYPLLKDRGLMKVESVLSDEGGSCGINGVRVLILSKLEAAISSGMRKKQFTHRVLAECDCGRLIPFGKLGQHRKSCKANLFD